MMEFTAKVMRTDFTMLRQRDLFNYADNVVVLTTGERAYDVIRTELDALKTVNVLYGASLTAIESGTKTKTREKDLLLAQVEAALNAVSDGLDANANGDTMYIFNAGFGCQKGSRRKSVEPETPIVVSISATLKEGEVEIVLAKTEGSRSFAFEFSDDDSKTWQNGQYSTRLRNTLKVTPHSAIWVRVCALGSGTTKSPFCEPVFSRAL